MNLLQETLDAIELSKKEVSDIEEYYIEIDKSFQNERYVPRSNENVLIIEGSFGTNLVKEPELNLEYDDCSGSGGQYIEGWISFKDNSWLQRTYISEYGEEGWEYFKCPKRTV